MRYYVDGVDPLVSLDLFDVLDQAFAASDVRAIQDLGELDAGQSDGPSILISARPRAELQTHDSVLALLRRNGGVVVLNGMSSPRPNDGENWITVMRPFDDATLVDAIRQVMPGE